MNNKRKIAILMVTIIILSLSAGVIYAQQDGGNGRGNGRGNFGTQLGDNTTGTQRGGNRGGNGAANTLYGDPTYDNTNDNLWNNQESGSMSGYGQGGINGGGLYNTLPPATTDTLPDDIVSLMIAGWQDEIHAYTVYQSVIDQFGTVAPFVSIQRAEAQHLAAWEFMFDRYGIPVPEVPVFDNLPTFASLSEACQIAADAEIANFSLYDDMQQTFSAYPDIAQIATALRDASEFSHLPAFENCAG